MPRKSISAQVRHEQGKGPARRLRAEGMIPAILYGGGLDPVSLSLDPHALRKALDRDLKRNTLLRLEVTNQADASCEVMVKDAQVDTLHDEILHVDLIRITEDALVDVQVPLSLTGRAEGVRLGGVLQQILWDIPIRCKASAIPKRIEVDTTTWELHHQLRAEELPLPEGIESLVPPRQKLAAVVPGRAEEEETTTDTEEETDEESAEVDAPAAE